MEINLAFQLKIIFIFLKTREEPTKIIRTWKDLTPSEDEKQIVDLLCLMNHAPFQVRNLYFPNAKYLPRFEILHPDKNKQKKKRKISAY